MELDELIQAQRNLSEKDLLIYNSELQKKTKNIGLAYFLLIFFGGLGLHKFYLGKIVEGIVYLIVGTLDFIFLQIIIFNADSYSEPSVFVYILFGISAIFLLFDLFTLSEQIIVQEINTRRDLFRQFEINIEKNTQHTEDRKNKKKLLIALKFLIEKSKNIINKLSILDIKIKVKIILLVNILWIFLDLTIHKFLLFNATSDLVQVVLLILAIIISYDLINFYKNYILKISLLTISVIITIFLINNNIKNLVDYNINKNILLYIMFFTTQVVTPVVVLNAIIVFSYLYFEFINFISSKFLSYNHTHAVNANIFRFMLLIIFYPIYSHLNLFLIITSILILSFYFCITAKLNISYFN